MIIPRGINTLSGFPANQYSSIFSWHSSKDKLHSSIYNINYE